LAIRNDGKVWPAIFLLLLHVSEFYSSAMQISLSLMRIWENYPLARGVPWQCLVATCFSGFTCPVIISRQAKVKNRPFKKYTKSVAQTLELTRRFCLFIVISMAGAVQPLNSIWGCYFDVQIVLEFLFWQFCRNLKSQGTM